MFLKNITPCKRFMVSNKTYIDRVTLLMALKLFHLFPIHRTWTEHTLKSFNYQKHLYPGEKEQDVKNLLPISEAFINLASCLTPSDSAFYYNLQCGEVSSLSLRKPFLNLSQCIQYLLSACTEAGKP